MPQQPNIEDLFEDRARKGDGTFAVAFALMRIAEQQKAVAYQLGRLGLADAATPMGAIEALSQSILDSVGRLSDAVEGLQPE